MSICKHTKGRDIYIRHTTFPVPPASTRRHPGGNGVGNVLYRFIGNYRIIISWNGQASTQPRETAGNGPADLDPGAS
jgi:hypothetical protein